ncbi:MAG TPA: 3-methyl-2-oxobutanoate hydroxymethyltransferase [Dehalococcoidia bacterium]|nr:3-methyl-2-oxobutanoate hydroxymethyltransferase [Dehalococcoidia bacterium]
MGRRSIHSLRRMKERGERFSMVTCYDYPSARIVEEAGIPAVLVGDSLGTVLLGYESTVAVTLDDILHHVKPVVRGSDRAIVVADMPFGSYQNSADEAMRNATRLLQEGGATAVKLEGGQRIVPLVQRMVAAGIPVMGHLGLTPQSVLQLGGNRVQGKSDAKAAEILDDAIALERAGAFAIVLELIPASLAREITAQLRIPTVGIGAGIDTDGEIQVWHDILGLFPDFLPKHSQRFARLAPQIRFALENYAHAVRTRDFPGADQTVDTTPSTNQVLTALFDEMETFDEMTTKA